MKSEKIRQEFLRFFEKKKHRIVPSSSLVPEDDPTLLFANAGMNQFKDILSGKKKTDFKRAASCQKCIRVSGKHNDLEEVGQDTYHHTFFEMLGNWSFGEYFKKEAIIWGWEFLTEVCKLPKERLWASVFRDDDESEKLWYEHTDLLKGRVLRFDEKENFWEMGEVGPCGPSSEIHYDLGEEYSCGKPDCGVNCGCGRVIELWNLVFMEFYRDENGKLFDLPAKNVDTGMGFERLTAVLQGVRSNYDTDLFLPIIRKTEEISKKEYRVESREYRVKSEELRFQESFRVVADHIRALSFAIADGAIPSNEGRGYVLRRILRRASRHGRILGLHKPFLYLLTSVVADIIGKTYPELLAKKEHIALVIKSEEERFEETLDLGIELFEKVADNVKSKKEKTIPGNEAFKLYDTYGFPLDLTQVMAREKNLEVDLEGFDMAMRQQQLRSKEKGKFYSVDIGSFVKTAELKKWKTEFIYDKYEIEANCIYSGYDTGRDFFGVLIDKTTFYTEAGGQTYDTGKIVSDHFELEVTEAVKEGDVVIHIGKVKKGKKDEDLTGKKVRVCVDVGRRKSIQRNHTVTHLLHRALKDVLGEHVNQSGSLVAPDRLRFDFTHFKALDQAEMDKVESIVNQKIWENLKVETFMKKFDEAKKMGAVALFGEKYEDKVRVVKSGDYSMELCGGTHVNATGEIGLFKIISETSIAAGIRRIEAVTGESAYKMVKEQGELLKDLEESLKTKGNQLKDKVEELVKKNKQLEKKLKTAQAKSARVKIEDLKKKALKLDSINIIAYKTDVETKEALLELGDAIREKLKSTIGVLSTVIDKKIAFVAVVTDDLIKKKSLKAGDIVKEVAQLTGGSGGGKPHLAQAGGKDISKLDKALKELPKIVKKMLK
jgi:alanyl-tRNA synthetase